MRGLLLGLAAFAALVVLHVAVWRVHRPSGQYVALGGLTIAVLGLALSAPMLLQVGLGRPVGWLPFTAADHLNAAVLYGALFLAYLTTYSAVQADSPTMTILLRLAEAGPRGLTRSELLAELNDRVLVLPRLQDLTSGRLARREGARYVMAPRALALVRTHMAYRRLLALERGG